MLRVGGGADGKPDDTTIVVAKDECVALILVRDLIERSDEPNARLDGEYFTAETNFVAETAHVRYGCHRRAISRTRAAIAAMRLAAPLSQLQSRLVGCSVLGRAFDFAM